MPTNTATRVDTPAASIETAVITPTRLLPCESLRNRGSSVSGAVHP